MRIRIRNVWWCWLAHSKWRRRTTLLSHRRFHFRWCDVVVRTWATRCVECSCTDEEKEFERIPHS